MNTIKTESKPTTYCGKPATITVEYGLRQTGGAPYFSVTGNIVTADSRRRNDSECGGCIHEEIAKHFGPKFDDFIALHLSAVNGKPIYAFENGWYWLAGAMGGLGEDYHGGKGKGAKSAMQCFEVLCSHLRIGIIEGRALMETIQNTEAAGRREVFANYVEAQSARWKREADAAIEKHGLQSQRPANAYECLPGDPAHNLA